MKEITVFKEDHIMAVDDNERSIMGGRYERSEFRCYGDEPIVVTNEENFKIHEIRKGAIVSKLDPALSEAKKRIEKQGFQRIKEDLSTIYFEKSFKFIVMNKELDEIINKAIDGRDQSRERLFASSLKELVDSLQSLNNKQLVKIYEFHELFKSSNNFIENIAKLPWYKRIFKWKESILAEKKHLEKMYRGLM